VAHIGAAAADTGHFRLTVDRGGKAEVMSFRGGQTEVWLNPPKGDYVMKLDLVSNLDPQKVIASTAPQKLLVTSSAQSM
jgi:hypothetical protein